MAEALYVIKEGWLTKQGGVFKTWKRRWFTLIGRGLSYYKEQGVQEKGKIELAENVTVELAPEAKKKNAFKIKTTNRIYLLYADDEKIRDSWIETIRSVIDGSDGTIQLTLDDINFSTVINQSELHKISQISRKIDPDTIYIMKSYPRPKNEKIAQDQLEIRSSILKKKLLYVAPLKFIIPTDSEIHLISENMKGGTLLDKVNEMGKIPENIAMVYIAQLLVALDHFHKNHIIYCDLTITNVLLDSQGNVGLTDPGIKDVSKTLTITEYTAPELITDIGGIATNNISESNDWYCVGSILYEMIAGLPPFWEHDKQNLPGTIKNQKLMFPHHVSTSAKNFIRKLMERNPAQRLGSSENGFEDIKRDPFFSNISWDQVMSKTIKIPKF